MGFINLIAFGYISLISLVVLIYFFSKKKRIIEVPSIMPWSVLRDDVARSRLFKIDLLFLLQILLILILISFLARPYLKSNIVNIFGKNIILIIDSSASMQTNEDEGTRFDQARNHALKMVNRLNQWDKMMIISTNYTSRIICDFTDDRSELIKLINSLKPVDTGTNLDEGINLGISYLNNVERGEVYVLTDRTQSSLNTTKLEKSNIKFIRYGKNSANVAITSLDVYQDMFKDYLEREAYVTIKNYSDTGKNVELKMYLNDKIINEEKLILSGGEQETVKVNGLITSGILKAEIRTDDFLAVDNTAYAIINTIQPIKILLVSDETKLKNELEKIQQITHRIIVTRIGTMDYTPEVIKEYDVAIFHKLVPHTVPGINSLYIYPSTNILNYQNRNDKKNKNPGNLIFAKRTLSKNIKILDWLRTHPTMKHLDNLDNIIIKDVLEIVPPEWAEPIIKVFGPSKDVPIAIAGKYAGKRIIALGFDPGEFDFSRSDNLQILIMVLNLIQWLNPYEIEGQSKILTGGQYVPNYTLNGNIEILGPNDETSKFEIKKNTEGTFVFNKINYTGEYKISDGNENYRFVANLFDENESNIKPGLAGNEEIKFVEKEIETSIEDKKNEFSKYLLLIVPFLLIIEWLIFYKKVRSGTA